MTAYTGPTWTPDGRRTAGSLGITSSSDDETIGPDAARVLVADRVTMTPLDADGHPIPGWSWLDGGGER